LCFSFFLFLFFLNPFLHKCFELSHRVSGPLLFALIVQIELSG
jgi:hypothetical protein